MDWKTVYQDAKEEFERLQQDRKKLEDSLALLDPRIEALATTMRALAPIIGEELPEGVLVRAAKEPGRDRDTTKSIRMVLGMATKELSAREISDRLAAAGWRIEDYSNPLSTIHTVLKRLVKYGEVKEVSTSDGIRFQWLPESVHPPESKVGAHPHMRDLCWQIVHESEQPLTTQDIAAALTRKTVDVSQYANITAVIHGHLDKMPDRVRSFKKRVQHQGEWQTFRFYEAIR
jgi:Fe2+ or Zn2+ uptake regulation protein